MIQITEVETSKEAANFDEVHPLSGLIALNNTNFSLYGRNIDGMVSTFIRHSSN